MSRRKFYRRGEGGDPDEADQWPEGISSEEFFGPMRQTVIKYGEGASGSGDGLLTIADSWRDARREDARREEMGLASAYPEEREWVGITKLGIHSTIPPDNLIEDDPDLRSQRGRSRSPRRCMPTSASWPSARASTQGACGWREKDGGKNARCHLSLPLPGNGCGES